MQSGICFCRLRISWRKLIEWKMKSEILDFSFRATAKVRADEAIEFRIRYYRKFFFLKMGRMTSTFCQTVSISAPCNEECSPRAIGATLQQAPCIIRNRPIKAFDQAPLPLHSWPCYRRALAFLSSPPTWRLSLQSLPSSPLASSLLFPVPRQPRRPPGYLPSHFPTGSPRLLLLLFLFSFSLR